jgi:hypothetical protein
VLFEREGERKALLTGLGIATFFTVMTVAEGGGRRAVSHKLRDMYLPTLKANFMVWPLVQMINFRIMPIQFQLVSYLPSCSSTSLTRPAAICVYNWYRLDSISLSIQCRRGGCCSLSSSVAEYQIAIGWIWRLGLGRDTNNSMGS